MKITIYKNEDWKNYSFWIYILQFLNKHFFGNNLFCLTTRKSSSVDCQKKKLLRLPCILYYNFHSYHTWPGLLTLKPGDSGTSPVLTLDRLSNWSVKNQWTEMVLWIPVCPGVEPNWQVPAPVQQTQQKHTQPFCQQH